uniref:Uncharacterized protein n=1 Tax=Anguilla anguilla TaxID=7936 RepID=A0A0E9QVH6_ANGAN
MLGVDRNPGEILLWEKLVTLVIVEVLFDSTDQIPFCPLSKLPSHPFQGEKVTLRAALLRLSVGSSVLIEQNLT